MFCKNYLIKITPYTQLQIHNNAEINQQVSEYKNIKRFKNYIRLDFYTTTKKSYSFIRCGYFNSISNLNLLLLFRLELHLLKMNYYHHYWSHLMQNHYFDRLTYQFPLLDFQDFQRHF